MCPLVRIELDRKILRQNMYSIAHSLISSNALPRSILPNYLFLCQPRSHQEQVDRLSEYYWDDVLAANHYQHGDDDDDDDDDEYHDAVEHEHDALSRIAGLIDNSLGIVIT